MTERLVVEPEVVISADCAMIIDCRFSLTSPEEGRRIYNEGHVPGAHYLDLNKDLAGAPGRHGGRHPLPDPGEFAATLAGLGISLTTEVIAYDDAHFAFAARLWWLMRSLGYRPPRLLNGGYAAFLAAGGVPERAVPRPEPCLPPAKEAYTACLGFEQLRLAQANAAVLIDSREARRYAGLEEPIDPVAGHIPGAVNRPWQDVTDASGRLLGLQQQRERWGELADVEQLVVYCGSGVTACANLFALAQIGRPDAQLYAGSWSDWCSYLKPPSP